MPKKKRKLIYISGPLSAETRWGVELNQEHLKKMGLFLIRKGFAVIVPFWYGDFINRDELTSGLLTRTRGLKWKLEDQIMASDIESIRRCDAILMCRGWKRSKGARMEYDKAKEFGLEILYEKNIMEI